MKPRNVGSLKDFKLLFKNYKQSDKQITLGELSKLTDAQAYLEEALLGDGKFSSRDRLHLKRTDFVLANTWSLYTEERAFEAANALQWLKTTGNPW